MRVLYEITTLAQSVARDIVAVPEVSDRTLCTKLFYPAVVPLAADADDRKAAEQEVNKCVRSALSSPIAFRSLQPLASLCVGWSLRQAQT